MAQTDGPDAVWWKTGAIYQVYPRSFQDTDGDGVGDLRGITARLDHLAWLGVDAVWISPVYPSPMADFGYDVADYCGVDPLFGTLADFDALVAAAHARGLRVILDFVPNHSSIAHPWFAQSRASRASPKRDWYIWRDAAPDGGPPNNWLSNFGGPAWTWDATTGQYYYHAFLPEQPDLNWRNPAVRAAMHDALRFWLERGVDGFRVDVIWHLMKDEAFRDNPPNPAYGPGQAEINRFEQVYNADRPEVFAVIAEMRAVLRAYGERVLIGEIYLPVERLVAYYGPDLTGADLPFNFQLILTPWRADAVAALVAAYEAALPPGGWPNWVLGNHDQARIAARVGDRQARVAAMLLLTLRGTPTLYYGDEVGLGAVPIPPGRARDPWERREPGHGRDPARTPMQWDASLHAGFTHGEPWLPQGADSDRRNVAMQRDDPASILTLYRRLLDLRRVHPALSVGGWRAVAPGDDSAEAVFAYERFAGAVRVRVLLNFGDAPRTVPIDGAEAWRVLLSTDPDRLAATAIGVIALAPDEGIILIHEALS